jgi:hypothetical protein
MSPSVTELAWAAGFFDGEGSTCLCNNSLRLQVSQNELEPLERFRVAVGVGKINRRWRTNGFKDRWNYMYWVGGANAKTALDLLWPYLSSIKRRQALKAFNKIKQNPWSKPYTREELGAAS